MKTYDTQEEFLKDCNNNIFEIEDNIELNFDLYYPKLKIKCKDLKANDILANDLTADNIYANNIIANNIKVSGKLTAHNIAISSINNIYAGVLDVYSINKEEV